MPAAKWTWDDWQKGQLIQCNCGRCIVWRGTDNAYGRGWGAKWKPGADGWAETRVWYCPDCYVPARLPT